MPEIATTCRICESSCGILATVEGGELTKLAPDRDHPLSKGYACRKGLRFADVHGHADRVLRPLVRANREDALSPIGWDAALADLGGRLRQIRDAHGRDSVGLYVGNAVGNSLGAILGVTALQRALGSFRQYSCLTLDNSEMFVVLERCLGNPMLSFVADYERSDAIVLIGTDPLSSQPSQAQSQPDGVRALLRNAAALTVLDPRRSATARKAAHHLQPRPGTDVFVLAWLVREALAARPVPPMVAADDRDALAAAVAGFDRDRAAQASGLTADELDALRARLLGASRPLVWSGLGVLLGPHGTVGWWLTLCLQTVLGGLDAAGGWVWNRGAVDVAGLSRRLGLRAVDPAVRSRRGHPAILGTIAAATLADDALAGDLKALICVGGNPAISLPDSERARSGLASLDLLVAVDLFVNDTGALAHAVLPATNWLEREEIAVHAAHTRRLPHLQVAPAVVAPRGEARDDFAILIALARAAGLRPFGSRAADLALRAGMGPRSVARAAVAASAPFAWRDLVRAPRGIGGADPVGALARRGTDRPDRRLLLAVPELCEALAAVAAPAAGLQLVTSVRPVETMNSWLHEGARSVPIASMHPDDLAAIGAPSKVWLQRPDGVGLTVDVCADSGVRRGVVVLPFGWGHLPGAVGAPSPGTNANILVSTATLEPFTGQPISNGLPVVAAPARAG
jgi:anaerobic selenocysteine-containing dehydrogenase